MLIFCVDRLNEFKETIGAVNEDEAYKNLQGMKEKWGISTLMQLTAGKKTGII